MIKKTNKKYRLTNETIKFCDHTLYRIKAIKNFGNIKKGDLGGYIESESNLSHEGDCWLYNNAKVFGNAKIYDNAKLYDNARVSYYARVYGHAKLYGHTEVFGYAQVFGYTRVFNYAKIYDYAKLYNLAKIYGKAQVYGNAKVYDHAEVHSNAILCGNAIVSKTNDYKVFKNDWSSGRYFTYTKSNKMWKAGCFYGTGKELIEKAYEDSELSGKMYEQYVNFVENLENLENLKN